MKYMADFIEHFKDRSAFSIRDSRIFLKQKKISREYLYYLIQYLLKRKKMERVARGFYTFREDPIVAGFAFQPFYYGLQQALSLHGLWQQETNLVIITPRKVRSGLRRIMESNIVVKRIDERMFFGFELERHYNEWIPVSSIEKTLVDFAYFNEPLSREALKAIKHRLNKKVLQQYLEKTTPRTRKKVKALLSDSGVH